MIRTPSLRPFAFALALSLSIGALPLPVAAADPVEQTKGSFKDKFRQLEGEAWPTPTDYRNAAGAPGHRYWQQKVDYRITASLDEAGKAISGRQEVTYRNNSPDALGYLWLLLDQNEYKRNSLQNRTATVSSAGSTSFGEVRQIQRYKEWEGGFSVRSVTGADGRALPFTVVDTLMRIDLPQPLASGQAMTFAIDFSYPIPETKVVDGRGGYECFTKPGEDGNCLFLAAQWFPRLAVYSDYEGWHNKAFLGSGEFTLEFGDYDVSLTVPADHVVSSTGELANAAQVLSPSQQERLTRARTASEPVYVVTPQEAAAAERGRASGTKTWNFRARNVRDFAWASSRKFIWDAMGVRQDDPANPLVMAMSFFPKEARPLWDAYSTKAIAHTVDVYGDFAFPYPYPVAQSVNGPVGGMEYPMITFNGPRPVKDAKTGALTYTERAKTGLIGVVIHEVGHIWFPMAVNSDERQWTWMDEGLNTFLQFQAEKRWDPKFPSRRGEPESMVEYMVSQNQVPIMTQSDSLLQFGSNSYGKPATALVILRETVLGRELFDKAFRDYATRWRFKRPTPYDFFRTMEESSGVDLDWFWRGWFYSTDHVDIALESVVRARLNSGDVDAEAAWNRSREAEKPESLTVQNNRSEGLRPVIEQDPATRDYYDRTDRLAPTAREREAATKRLQGLEPEDRAALAFRDNIYHLTFRNVGGVVMPIPLRLSYSDGSSETLQVPAEIWRRSPDRVTWRHVSPKTLTGVEVDPRREIADANRNNNFFPQRIDAQTLKVEGAEEAPNRMRDNDVTVTPDSLQTRSAPRSR